MKVWIGGETDAKIYDDFRVIRNSLEKAIKSAIVKKKYGSGLRSWDVIPIILAEQELRLFPEISEYDPKTKECEFRLHVDYAAFAAADDQGKYRLLCEMLLRSLDLLAECRIEKFDLDRLKSDFVDAVSKCGWINK